MNKKDKILKMLLIMVISGIFGFIYETIFYRIDLGYFVKRGDTLGPWLPIYSFGGLLITLICVKDSNNSFEIFLSWHHFFQYGFNFIKACYFKR